MHHPAHSGELLGGWHSKLSLSVTALAEHIGNRRVMLNRVLNCRPKRPIPQAHRTGGGLRKKADTKVWLQ